MKYVLASFRHGRAILAMAALAVVLAPGKATASMAAAAVGWLTVRSFLPSFRRPIDAAARREAWREAEEERLQCLAGLTAASRHRAEALQLRIETLAKLRGGPPDPAEAAHTVTDAREFAALHLQLLMAIDEIDQCAPAAAGAGEVTAGREAMEPLRQKRRAELAAQCRDAEQSVESLLDRAAVGSATGDVRLRLETLRNVPELPGFSAPDHAERPRRAYEGHDH